MINLLSKWSALLTLVLTSNFVYADNFYEPENSKFFFYEYESDQQDPDSGTFTITIKNNNNEYTRSGKIKHGNQHHQQHKSPCEKIARNNFFLEDDFAPNIQHQNHQKLIHENRLLKQKLEKYKKITNDVLRDNQEKALKIQNLETHLNKIITRNKMHKSNYIESKEGMNRQDFRPNNFHKKHLHHINKFEQSNKNEISKRANQEIINIPMDEIMSQIINFAQKQQ